MDIYDEPYLKKQLIAYIGNKRRLLPFLGEILLKIDSGRSKQSFLDPFSGSGAVSRLAAAMGYRVYANDIEYYSYCINLCHLQGSRLFFDNKLRQSIDKEIDYLNSLPLAENGYMAKHYAPASLRQEDFKGRRLFYTPRNARFIDTVRNEIDCRYPVEAYSEEVRSGLLAPLIYQAATHANTSGVFKAFHAGFGGHNGDALSRILHDMKLQIPLFSPISDAGSRAYNMDAEEFCRCRSGDICYLDPPYNQHQYGSNYHILNTVAKWDKPHVSNELDKYGNLKEKAGIRHDWLNTRSDFCSRPRASAAMKALLDTIDSRYIVISYNTEGIIPFDELLDIASSAGHVSIETREYTKYRGGRQSLNRKTHNLEFLIIIDRNSTAVNSGLDVDTFMIDHKLQSILLQTFSRSRLRKEFSDLSDAGSSNENGLILHLGEDQFLIEYGIWFRDRPGKRELANLTINEKRVLYEKLQRAAVKDRAEELSLLIDTIDRCAVKRDKQRLFKKVLRILRKLAHKKYRDVYIMFAQVIADTREKWEWIGEGEKKSFAELNALAEKRFSIKKPASD